MQEDNPYAAPSSNLGGQDSYGDDTEGVTRGVVAELAGTKGWTRFIGVLAILGAVGVVIGGFAVLDDVGRFSNALRFDLRGGTALVVVITLLAALFLGYGILLNSFSSSVNKLINQGTERALYEALRRQRTFWIFWGVISIVTVVFAIIGALS